MKKQKIDKNVIDIGYDKTNGRYIAYNTHTGIFATGICIESACEAYRALFYGKKAKK